MVCVFTVKVHFLAARGFSGVCVYVSSMGSEGLGKGNRDRGDLFGSRFDNLKFPPSPSPSPSHPLTPCKQELIGFSYDERPRCYFAFCEARSFLPT